jgi:hypothetical protein
MTPDGKRGDAPSEEQQFREALANESWSLPHMKDRAHETAELDVSGVTSDTTWLMRFVARLLRLKQELSALEAARIACTDNRELRHFAPEVAAEIWSARNMALG